MHAAESIGNLEEHKNKTEATVINPRAMSHSRCRGEVCQSCPLFFWGRMREIRTI